MNKVALFLLCIPLSVHAVKNGYHLDTQKHSQGYKVRVVNNTPANLTCYLSTGTKRPKKIIIPSYSTSQAFIFNTVPKLQCKVR